MFPLKIIKRMVADCRDAAVPSGSASINISSSSSSSSSSTSQANDSHVVPDTAHASTTQSAEETDHDYDEAVDDLHEDHICGDYYCVCSSDGSGGSNPSDSSDGSDSSVAGDSECNNADCKIEIMRKDAEISIINSRTVALQSEMVVQKDDLDKANKVVSGVTEALQCPICLDTFTNPHVLRCGHTYCQECLIQWLERNKICPSCRSFVISPPAPSITLRNIISCTIGDVPANPLSPTSSALGASSHDNPWQRVFPHMLPRTQSGANNTHIAPVAVINPENPANRARLCVSCSSPLSGSMTVCRVCSIIQPDSNQAGLDAIASARRTLADHPRSVRDTQERLERFHRQIVEDRLRTAERRAATRALLTSRPRASEEQTSGGGLHSSTHDGLNDTLPSTTATTAAYLARLRDTRGDRITSLLRQLPNRVNTRSRIPVSTPVSAAASSPAQSSGSTSASSRGNILISRILGHGNESSSSSSSSHYDIDMLDRTLDRMISELESQDVPAHGRHLNALSSLHASNPSGDAAAVSGSRDAPSEDLSAHVYSRDGRTRIPLYQPPDSPPSDSATENDLDDPDDLDEHDLAYEIRMRELMDRLEELNASDLDHD